MYDARRITYIALFIAIATVLNIVEKAIVIPGALPGIKLGLANIMTLLSIMMLGGKDAVLIVAIRCVLGAMIAGNPVSFLFSITGGLLSILVMALLWHFFKERVSIIIVSMIGAVFHNIGQLLVAAVLVNSYYVYSILPVLMVSALATGYIIGLVSKRVYRSIGQAQS